MGVLKLKSGPSLKLKSGPSFFFHCFPHLYSVFWAFLETQIVQQCVKIVFLQNLGDVKNEVFGKKIAFFVFFPFLCWKNRNRKKKKSKMAKAKKPYKNRFFLRWSSKNVKNQTKWIFSKNWLTLFVSAREKKNAHFRAHYLFWPKIFWAQNSANQENL